MANPAPIGPTLPGTWSMHQVLLYAQTLMTWYGDAPIPNFVELRFQGPDAQTASAATGWITADDDTDATLWGVVNALHKAISKYGQLVPMPNFSAIRFALQGDELSPFRYHWVNDV